MRRFAELLDRLVLTPSRNGKLKLLADHFSGAEDPDRGLALAAMLFPFNTHFAFYSSFWSLLLFWLVAWFCAALRDPVPDA